MDSTIAAHEARLANLEKNESRQTAKIDEIAEEVSEIKVMVAQAQECDTHMGEKMTTFADSITVDYMHRKMDSLEVTLAEMSENIKRLEQRPYDHIDKVVTAVITAAITFIVTYTLTQYLM